MRKVIAKVRKYPKVRKEIFRLALQGVEKVEAYLTLLNLETKVTREQFDAETDRIIQDMVKFDLGKFKSADEGVLFSLDRDFAKLYNSYLGR